MAGDRVGKETKVLLALIIFTGGLILGIKYIFPLVAPFILGIIFACLIEPLVRRIQSHWRLNRNLTIILVLFFFLAGIVILFTLTVLAAYQEARRLLPLIYSVVERLARFRLYFVKYLWRFLPNLREYSGSFSFYPEMVGRVFQAALAGFLNLIPHFPQILIAVFLGGVTAYFVSRDKEVIGNLFYRILPPRWHHLFGSVKEEILGSLAKFIRAECLLVLLTALTTAFFFKMLKIPGALAYGFLAGMLDIIPVLGPGLVYLPLIAVNLLFNNFPLAILLGLSYFLLLMIRQLAEIKLLGGDLNFHPLLIIFFIYVGAKLFGFIGFFTGPVLVIAVRGYYRALLR